MPLPVNFTRFFAELRVLIFGIIELFRWDQNHKHGISLSFRRLVQVRYIFQRFIEKIKLFFGDVTVGRLSSPEDERHFNTVLILQEFAGLSRLGLQIVLINAKRQADTLHLSLLLLAFMLPFQFCLPVQVLSKIQDFTDRRISFWSHFNQVQPDILGPFEGLFKRPYPKLLTILINEAYLGNFYLVIGPELLTNIRGMKN